MFHKEGEDTKVRSFVQKHDIMTPIRDRTQTTRDPDLNTLTDNQPSCRPIVIIDHVDIMLLFWALSFSFVMKIGFTPSLWEALGFHRSPWNTGAKCVICDWKSANNRKLRFYLGLRCSRIWSAAWAVQHTHSYWKVGPSGWSLSRFL